MIPTPEAAPLSNKTILITRPTGREQQLRQLIEQSGGHVIHYPVIQIQPLTPPACSTNQLGKFTMAIFISKTAVECSQHYFSLFPENIIIVSIGSKTTESLKQHNIQVDIEAPEQNTESLLLTPAFQTPEIKDKQILIFRGEGGRALLGDTLSNRGAVVTYIETYRREIPCLKALSKKQISALDAITVSSNEGLENLLHLTLHPDDLIDIPLVVPSKRTEILAGKYGFRSVLTAQNATDEAFFAALISLFST